MATYAIGDIQGCFTALQQLLRTAGFDAAHDRVWLVGDLVNRGAESLAALRWAREMGDRLVMVLGNHDLHLLAVAEGYVQPRRSDTLAEILAAPDRAVLLDWLRRRPLLHVEGEWVMVHAGLLPQWNVAQAQRLAAEVETVLRADDYRDFLAQMYGNTPTRWRDDLRGIDRLRLVTNVMSRLRFCSPVGEIEFAHKGLPEDRPAGFLPWYAVPARASTEATVIFGHWSALGYRREQNTIALDSGCLWSGRLTALRLEDQQVFQLPCAGLPGVKKHWQ